MEDYGIVDVDLKGEGMSISINWKLISNDDQPPHVKLSSTKCRIDKLDIHFVKDKTKHNIIDRIAVRLLNNTIKRRIANAVAEYLQVKVTQIDDQINAFFATRPIHRMRNATSRSLPSKQQEQVVERTKEETTATAPSTVAKPVIPPSSPVRETKKTETPTPVTTIPVTEPVSTAPAETTVTLPTYVTTGPSTGISTTPFLCTNCGYPGQPSVQQRDVCEFCNAPFTGATSISGLKAGTAETSSIESPVTLSGQSGFTESPRTREQIKQMPEERQQ